MWKEADVRLCIYMIMYILCLHFILNEKLLNNFKSGEDTWFEILKKDFRDGWVRNASNEHGK